MDLQWPPEGSRVISVVLLMLAAGGCRVSRPPNVPREEWCELHSVPMHEDWVSVWYGLPSHHYWELSATEAKHFPNANTSLFGGGCVTHPGAEKWRKVYYCPRCRAAKAKFSKSPIPKPFRPMRMTVTSRTGKHVRISTLAETPASLFLFHYKGQIQYRGSHEEGYSDLCRSLHALGRPKEVSLVLVRLGGPEPNSKHCTMKSLLATSATEEFILNVYSRRRLPLLILAGPDGKILGMWNEPELAQLEEYLKKLLNRPRASKTE